jgi:hypothetical protein
MRVAVTADSVAYSLATAAACLNAFGSLVSTPASLRAAAL